MTASVATETGPDGKRRAPRSLAMNAGSIFVGRMFAALSMWLALIALTKMTDAATVGIYALAQAICIPIAEMAKLSLMEMRSSDSRREAAFGSYLALRLLASAVALLLMIGIGAVQSLSWAMLLVMGLYALTRCAELVSDMLFSLFQTSERMDYIGRSLCLAGPLSLLLLVAGFWVSGSLVVAVLGQLIAHVAILALHDVPVAHRLARLDGESLRPVWNPASLRRLALQAMPLSLATLLVIVALFLPRIAVEHELGLSELGLFAAILAMAMAPDRLVNAVGAAAAVRLARVHATGHASEFLGPLLKMASVVAAFGVAGIAISLVAGEPILRAVYTEDYAAHSDVLVWLVVAATLRGVANVLRYGVVAARRFWWVGAHNAAAAMVAVGGSLVLIPRFGLVGAGMTMTLIFAAQLAVIVLGVLASLRALPRARTAA